MRLCAGSDVCCHRLLSQERSTHSAKRDAGLLTACVPLQVRETDRFMVEGGTELAFMSTTSNIELAVKYSLSPNSLLLKIRVKNFMQMGADVQWLSAFPGEAEFLYPPLTYLEPTGRVEKMRVKGADGKKIVFTVLEVEPTMA